ncbi:hypothetical protein Bb109J_c1947 [Bdellovibrio bacteriovorus]|uniref:hypothetical protein n=1 Tax=Bdellovibrio bacteriovorus TaxID=959 RepID=UPI00045C047A|nr:hypothetical protein [Bdellovibrio bacteriovorus]AHZ84637.1 hypothetical protein EP01_06760 [Bdellovibrio bacteriovorus]BEV68527.1 hypothetical protein Bb109J_c1947 [Bdellovibrio bacteriovorus]
MRFIFVFLLVLLQWSGSGLAWTQTAAKVIQADQVSGTSTNDNYLKQGDAEILITGINQYADAAAEVPVDCAGGSGSLTMSRTNSAPLYHKWSWLISKPAGNLQGHGVAIDFTINNGDKRTAMQFVAEYLVNSGTFVHGTTSDLRLYVYDVTNTTMLLMANNTLPHASATDSKPVAQATFNTTTSTNYRACFHVATTNASAWSLKAEALINKFTIYNASAAFDWKFYPGAITSSSGTMPAHTVNYQEYRRDSDGKMWMRGKFTFTSTGTWGGIIVPNPPGITNPAPAMDGTGVSKITLNDASDTIYTAQAIQQSNQLSFYGENVGGASNKLQSINNTTPFTWAVGDSVAWEVGPINVVGWPSAQPAVSLQNWNFDWRDCPSGFNDSWTNTTVTCKWKRDGGQAYYQYHMSVTGTPAGTDMNLTLPTGHVIDVARYVVSPVGGNPINSHVSILDNGTRFYYGNVSGNTTNTLRVNALLSNIDYIGNVSISPTAPMAFVAGDNVIAMFDVPLIENGVSWTETWNALQLINPMEVVVRTSHATALSIGTSSVVIPYATEIEDKLNAWSSGTFTAPYDGLYQVTPHLVVGGGYSLSVIIQKGVSGVYSSEKYLYSGTRGAGGSGFVRLLKGETIQIRGILDTGTSNTDSSGFYNRLDIIRIGD